MHLYFGTLFFRVLLQMTLLVPPETAPAWRDTYVETARAIADGCEARPILGSPARCAAVLVAIAKYESAFDPHALGDGGRSYGLFQIDVTGRWIKRGADVERQVSVAMDRIEESFWICGSKRPLAERLTNYAYGRGKCPAEGDAVEKSKHRMQLAGRLLSKEDDK